MRRKQQGFTLIELLVVMAIIAILASIVVPNIVGWIGRARMTRAQAEIEGIELALAKMLTDAGRDNLNEFFDNVSLRKKIADAVGGPEGGAYTFAQFDAAREIYTRSFYALLRDGRNALPASDDTLFSKYDIGSYADVLKNDVVKNLSANYVDIGFDPWGNLYQIFPAPWPRSNGPNIFRIFARSSNTSTLPGARDAYAADALSGSSTIPGFEFIETEYQETVVGYPAPRNPAAAFIYSFGANMASGQAIYQNSYTESADQYYVSNQEPDFFFGGDDINNWDSENSWGRFYN